MPWSIKIRRKAGEAFAPCNVHFTYFKEHFFFFNDTKESQFKNNTEIKVSKVPVKENIKTLQRYLMALKQEWKNEEEL